MFGNNPPKRLVVVGPEGFLINLESLPAPGTTRWVARRKAEVVAAVQGGLLTTSEACQRYGLSEEELREWQLAMAGGGLKGLMLRRRSRSKPSKVLVGPHSDTPSPG